MTLINDNLRAIHKLQEEISDLASLKASFSRSELEELKDTAKQLSDSLEYLVIEMLIEKKEERLSKL